MKAKHFIFFMMAAALLALGVPGSAFSQMKDMPMKGHGEGHGRMMGMGSMEMMGDMMAMCMQHADKIGLTDQIRKMKPVRSEMQKKQARFDADLKIAKIELMDILEVKDFDLEKAVAAVNNISRIKTAHHLEMLNAMKEMRTALTDEQFQKMKKMMPMKMGGKKPAGKMMKKQ